jgi:hypothetical protein
MAKYTSKRIKHFLDLPVTLVTDDDSIPTNEHELWDKVVKVTPDKNNFRDWGQWINKGRYMAYELSPYQETILIDTDYMVNSNTLLKLFELPTDFCCHDTTSFIMYPDSPQEMLSKHSYNTLWATVVMFRKTQRAKQIFECLGMIQKNFEHYANLHKFISSTYRNDYALTLATRIVNGQFLLKEDIIPWNLVHIAKDTPIYHDTEDEYNTDYTIMIDSWKRGKLRKEYITVKDTDFHVMSKENFMELIS